MEKVHVISRTKGTEMVEKFNDIMPTLNLSRSIQFATAKEFNRSIFDHLLSLKDCTGIRIYNAINDKGEHTFVLTAVNDNSEFYLDIKQISPKLLGEEGGGGDSSGVGNIANNCPSYTKSLVRIKT